MPEQYIPPIEDYLKSHAIPDSREAYTSAENGYQCLIKIDDVLELLYMHYGFKPTCSCVPELTRVDISKLKLD